MRSIIKKIVIGVVTASLVVGGTAGGLSYVKKKNQKEVMVVNVGSIASNWYTCLLYTSEKNFRQSGNFLLQESL